jgi:ParB-like chromosome segregation protein Spo0J
MPTDATRNPAAEAVLDEYGVPYELVDLDLETIVSKDYSQVRQPEHRAPKDRVDEYALQMANGSKFPPVVIAANDHSVIDGNTRVAAARRNGYAAIPAYVAKVANGAMARVIGAALNQMGGARLTDQELQEAAAAFLEQGFTDQAIARRLGRTAEWARKFRKRSEFDERMGAHPAAATVKVTARERLADIHQDAALNLVLDAVKDKGLKLDTTTAARLVTATKGVHSDAAAIEAVNGELAKLVPLAQGGPEPRERINKALVRAVKACEKHVGTDQKLAAELRALEVPLIEPEASAYRTVLEQLASSTDDLRAAVRDLVERLPLQIPAVDAA